MEQTSTNQKNNTDRKSKISAACLAGVLNTYKELSFAIKTLDPYKGRSDTLNIFLIQNKGSGPPGGCCNPATGSMPLPDYADITCNGYQSIKSQLKINIQYQLSIQFHN